MKDRENKNDEVWVTLLQGGNVYENYEISNYGRVWNIKGDFEVSQIETGYPVYKYVNLLHTNGKRVSRRVNNIMGWSFLGEPPSNKHTVDHIDRDKFNNTLDNLRWATKSQQAINRDVVLCLESGKRLFHFAQEAGVSYRLALSLYKISTCEDRLSYLIYLYLKYSPLGVSWKNLVELPSGNNIFLSEVVDKLGIDFHSTRELLSKGLSIEEIYKGSYYPLKEIDTTASVEVDIKGICEWFPSLKALNETYGRYSYDTLRERMKRGLTVEESLISPHVVEVEYQGVLDTITNHCNRNKVSLQRISTLISRYNLSLEDAINTPIKRINKFYVDGEIKRVKDWYAEFGIPPISANSWLNKSGKNRTFRETLEHYNVDTSGMEIYPCDGDIIMTHKPQ